MKNIRYLTTALLIVTTLSLLAGCAPGVTASLTRSNGDVTIQVSTGTDALDIVGVTVIGDDLSTQDARCDLIGDALSCDLGDLAADTTTSIVITGGNVSCIATGYAGDGLTDYRIVRCAAS